MALPTNIDATYADSATDPTVKNHQQYHDTLHTFFNTWETTAPADLVKVTGDQTIAGVKTFNASPIVPTPTTAYQAATKKFVDDSLAGFSGGGVAGWGEPSIVGTGSFSPGFGGVDNNGFGFGYIGETAGSAYMVSKYTSVTGGYVKNTGGGTLYMQAYKAGLVGGWATKTGAAGYSGMRAQSNGNFVWGTVRSQGSYDILLNATQVGAWAGGYAHGTAAGTSRASKVTASGQAAFAFGKAYSSTTGAEVVASGKGSRAFGYAKNRTITASGVGAGAYGYATGANISATANNAFQFGEGGNAQANSLSVGGGIRLSGGLVVPTTPRNGDIWTDGTDVFIRTGGVSKNITSLT